MIDEIADPMNTPWASKEVLDPMIPKQGEDVREHQVVNVTYKLPLCIQQKLLGEVLDVLSMTLPNKQQHTSAVHCVRKAFDDAYFKILQATYPDSEVGFSEGYAMEPVK